jgi:hypothetical protein
VPRLLHAHRRRRKISIEVHIVHTNKDDKISKKDGAFYEECIVRVLDPANEKEKISAYKRAKSKNKQHSNGNDQSSVTEDFGDDTSVSPGYLDNGSSAFVSSDVYMGWKTKYRFPIRCISIKGTHKTSVMVEITLDKTKEVRELIFDSLEEAEQFEAMIRRELSLEERRGEKKIAAALGDDTTVDASETITFLVEIVSGWNLPLGDFTSSDPYIKCYFDGKSVHKTDYISSARKFLFCLGDICTIEGFYLVGTHMK